MKNPSFRRVIIDPDVADMPIAKRYLAQAQNDPKVEVVIDGRSTDAIHAGETLSSGKRAVHITRHQGASVKQCTALEEHYVCCNLHVVNQTTNCPLDCSYCILQAYINQPVTTVAANTDQLLATVREQTASQPRRLFRIGTGDLGDALALDPIAGVTDELVPAFADIPNAILELKTKSSAVDRLLGLPHKGRTVVAWSMNPQVIIEAEEHLCASLDERLEAAQRAVSAGYPVAFHFDPMIDHDHWETHYPAVVRRIFEAVPIESVAWISMGTLRFPPSMLAIMKERFPKSRLTLGEFVHGKDGKMRYLKPIRIQMYRTLLSAIREYGSEDIFIYLCMEVPEVWRRVMGGHPPTNNALDLEMSQNLVRRFPHLLEHMPRFEDYETAVNLG